MNRWQIIFLVAATAITGRAAAEDPQPVLRLQGIALEDLTATLAKPLFSPDRRPPIPETVPEEGTQVEADLPDMETPVAEGTQPPDLTLVGIMIAGNRTLAILRDGQGRVHRLGSGETIAGWTLTVLDSLSVSLDNGEHRLARRLFAKGKGASVTEPVAQGDVKDEPATNLWR